MPFHSISTKIPKEILAFMDRHHELNPYSTLWLVGGCVRDLLLGRTPKDWDMVTTDPQSLAGEYPQIGKSFPVYQVRLEGEYVVEIAAARIERKVGDGHKGFEVELTKDIQQDLLRRDLTVNTFAWNPRLGFISSPMAGQDMRAALLRHVSPAFAEDPLRVFRVARFAAQLGWNIHPETLEFMRSLAPELPTLPKDRVRDELTKALAGPHPDYFFEALRDSGCLEYWFPEVSALIKKPHSAEHHPEGDAWAHTMMVLRKARHLGCEPMEMLCALGHDFGKALTDPRDWPRHLMHEHLGMKPISEFVERLGYGRSVEHAMRFVCSQHMNAHRAQMMRPVKLYELTKGASRSMLGIQGFARVCQSDHCGRGGHWDDEYPLAHYLLGAFLAYRSAVIDPRWSPERIRQEQVAKVKAYIQSTRRQECE